MIQNTNNNTRATQDTSKSATEVTRGFAKWLGFPVTWSEDRNRPSDLEEKFQVTWAEGIHTEFEVMAVSPQPRRSRGCGDIWESVVSQPWPKTRYQFLFYHGTTQLTLNKESFASQTASQLSKFKGQSHCKHWVIWPDCFATPNNHCDVRAGPVSLNYIDTLDKKMSQNMQWFKGNYKKTLKMYCWHISKNIDIIPLDKFASIISTNTAIDIFVTILYICVHFQHCF